MPQTASIHRHLETPELELGAVTSLSPAVRRRSAALWRAHVHPRLGDPGLRELEPAAITRFETQLLESGVAPESIQTTVLLLENVLGSAARRGAAPRRSSQQARPSADRPLEPRTVERLRATLGAREATIVSLLAYAGLRPGELLALRWRDVGGRRIVVDSRDQRFRSHTSVGGVREVRMLEPLAADLASWRTRGRGCGDQELVIPGPDGSGWSEHAWSEWRRLHFRPGARGCGLSAETRPYDLRHTFVWLMLRENASMADVARETGYSPMTALEIYRNLADRARRAGLRLAPEAIAVARAA